MDLTAFKEMQKKNWAGFGALESFTIPTAAELVDHAKIRAGQKVLDVGSGTGVVALTAAERGAEVTGLDLTPELVAQARQNSLDAGRRVAWLEGDAEALPFEDSSFDVVLSQFGHMFAPRAQTATSEMLRVLKPGGTIAFSTWPPEGFVGQMFALLAEFSPAPPPGDPPPLWGNPATVRERLGNQVEGVTFRRGFMLVPALNPAHYRAFGERQFGPLKKAVEALGPHPERLAQLRARYEALVAEHWRPNQLRQDFMMTRATKR